MAEKSSRRSHLLPAERLQLFTVYRDLNRFPKKEIFPQTNTKRKAKKKTQQPGGTGPSGPEKASEETRQRGGGGAGP